MVTSPTDINQLATNRQQPGWLDTLDLDLDGETRARLVAGAMPPGANQPGRAVAATPLELPKRRFGWVRLQKGRSFVFTILTLLSLLYLYPFTIGEIDGTGELTTTVILAIAFLLLGTTFLWQRLGEGLPFFGRSFAQLRPAGVRLHLFYGRQLRAKDVFSPGWRNINFSFPRWTTIPWAEVERLALYTVIYEPGRFLLPYPQLYWVKLWRADGRGYHILVSTRDEDARQLSEAIAARAGLRQWALLNERGFSPLQGSSEPLDQRMNVIWQLDRERMTANLPAQVSALLWKGRPTLSERPPRSFPLAARLLLVGLAVLLVASLAPYFGNQPVWSPSTVGSDSTWLGAAHDAGNSNASGQTLIPPLHEAWQANLLSGYSSNTLISVANGRVLVGNNNYITIFDAASGKQQAAYQLSGLGADLHVHGTDPTLSSDGRFLYYLSNQYVASDKPNDSYSSDVEAAPHLIALDLNANAIAWEHPVGTTARFRETSQPRQLVAVYDLPTNSPTHTIVEAIDAQSGASRWRKDTEFGGDHQLLANASTIYLYLTGSVVEADPDTGRVVAFDPSEGVQRWQQPVDKGRMLVDDQHLYVVTQKTVVSYSAKDGTKINEYQDDSPSDYNSSIQAFPYLALADGQLYALNQRSRYVYNNTHDSRVLGLKDGSIAWQTDFLYELASDYNDPSHGGMVASKGLLYLLGVDKSFFGKRVYRLYALDPAQGGRQVWQSAPIRMQYSSFSNLVIAGNTLYLTYDGQLHAYSGAKLAAALASGR